MKTRMAVALVALTTAFFEPVHATPLSELRGTQVSALEFGSFRLEVALAGIKDWPFPIEGASVASQVEPDQVEIVVAVRKLSTGSFRTACAETVGRVREFLYVGADGVPITGRSSLNLYFRGPWHGSAREAAFRAIDANTRIRVDVVGQGSCQAALIKAPIKFAPISSK